MKRYLIHGARILLGAIFFIQGLNGFFNFMPMPEMPAEANGFLGALAATGYFFPMLKVTETLAGLMLLSNRWVPLALLMLAPVTVNIMAFHLFLAPLGLPIAVVVVALEALLGYLHFDAFRAIFAMPGVVDRQMEEEAHPRPHIKAA
ncbi:MAG: DoxX family membrane protein [bacterium]|nr:DoxX family membrane protein [bacterium]